MPRPNGAVLTPPATTASAPLPLRTLDPRAVGTLAAWGEYLNLPKHCLKREARLGRLAVYRRAGRLWTDGRAILAWFHGGAVRRRQPTEAAGGPA
jgi:hypothetical protein